MRRLAVILVLALTLAGCGSGAVVFAPTPLPPDLSPLPYRHPGGAFTAVIPRDWSVYEQNTTTLASAAFSPPGAAAPLARFAVVNTGQLVDSGLLAAAINRYQTELRPGAARYQEVSRSAMGDGSWRLVGLLHTPSGQTQPLNTFIEADGAAGAAANADQYFCDHTGSSASASRYFDAGLCGRRRAGFCQCDHLDGGRRRFLHHRRDRQYQRPAAG
jgi:hypothetical protein